VKDVEVMKTVDVVREDVGPDQIRLVLTGSDKLKNSGASYVKYKLRYGENNMEK
jgi:hypothetical protein